jgi:hypothetical protein
MVYHTMVLCPSHHGLPIAPTSQQRNRQPKRKLVHELERTMEDAVKHSGSKSQRTRSHYKMRAVLMAAWWWT